MKPLRRAVVVGYPYYARYLSQLFVEQASHWQLEPFSGSRAGTLRGLLALRHAGLLISVGGPGPDAALVAAARAYGVPVIVMWVGSDVLSAADETSGIRSADRREYYDIADAPWLVDELRPLGIQAEFVAVTAARAPETLAPLPAQFRVLTYLPEPRRLFYGEGRVYAIARAMPETEFVVVGRGAPNHDAPRNVTFRGHVRDMDACIDAATVVLRLADHDGLSMLVLEALARGRHVVWTHAIPGAFCASGTERPRQILQHLARAHERHELVPNVPGCDYVRRHFAPAGVARGLEVYFERIAESHRTAGAQRTPRPAIIGEIDVAAKVLNAWKDARR